MAYHPRRPPRRKKRRRSKSHDRFKEFVRSEVAPDFRQMLCRLRPDPAKESGTVQAALAWVVWCARVKGRQHSRRPGAFFLSFRELEALFGQDQFTRLNDRLRVVEVVRDWLPQGASYDFLPGEATRAYRLVSDIDDAQRGYFDSLRNAVIPLIHASGRRCLTPPQAIAPKKRDGSPRKVWRGVRLRNRTPVNLDALHSLCASLAHVERHGWSSAAECAQPGPKEREYIGSLREEAEDIIHWANTDAAGRGFIAHRYVESDYGRLTAMGANLQSCWGVIRRTALQGLWDLDVSNCHLAVVEQLARERGVHCHEIRRYLAHKKLLREQLARRHLLRLDEVKQCLIAIVYGAYVSSDPDYALAELVGSFRASTFINDPDVRGIADDVKKARRAILESWPKGKRRLHNPAGGSIALVDPVTRKETTPAERLACIVQGIEAAMLRAMVRDYGRHIVLLQHDGFTSDMPLDCAKLQALIERETGFSVAMEQEQIATILPTQLSEILGTHFSSQNKDLESIWASTVGATAPWVVGGGGVVGVGGPGGPGGLVPSVPPGPSLRLAASPVLGSGWVRDPFDPWCRLRRSPLYLPQALVREWSARLLLRWGLGDCEGMKVCRVAVTTPGLKARALPPTGELAARGVGCGVRGSDHGDA